MFLVPLTSLQSAQSPSLTPMLPLLIELVVAVGLEEQSNSQRGHGRQGSLHIVLYNLKNLNVLYTQWAIQSNGRLISQRVKFNVIIITHMEYSFTYLKSRAKLEYIPCLKLIKVVVKLSIKHCLQPTNSTIARILIYLASGAYFFSRIFFYLN